MKLNLKSPRYAAKAMGRIRKLHFVGIGGAGMNGIAHVMMNLNYQVSGSDIRTNAATDRLKEQGAKIFVGHDANNIESADAIITSSAVTDKNPEVKAAKKKRIPVVPRAEMLAEIMRFHFGVAVAGTHGKTTTTSLVASILIDAGLDPTYVIGGKLNSAGSYAHLGEGEVLVAEADESDASFLYLQPMLAIVTNVDEDHMATYDYNFDRLKETFLKFIHHIPFYGLVVLCLDDPNTKNLLPSIKRRVKTYGFEAKADIRGINFQQKQGKSSFEVSIANKENFLISFSMPGKHNALNALAAISVALELGVDIRVIQQSLKNFQGIDRRFQISNKCFLNKSNFMLIDDYGHHPYEIAETIDAIRKSWPEKRLVLAFQPHRFTRTRDSFDDFTSVLSEVDILLICEVYSAGEEFISGADGRALCRAIRMRGKVDPIFFEDISELPKVLEEVISEGDIVLTAGAGNIGNIATEIRNELCTK
tara:strand:- start:103 stop:1533 length:1431 start_codon:yes stop_codon:yes gene_type:complete